MGELPENAVDVSQDQDGGVMKVIKTAGSGNETPMPGDNVTVHYVGTLFGGDEDGKQFDSSRDRGDPFKFKIGEGQVIKGWDQGVASMKKGELCDLICKPDYAYGENGSPPNIPPNSTLKFEVELLSWSGEDLFDDGGVIRSVIQKGEGYTNPTEGSKVTVYMKGTFGEKTIDERLVSFDLGDGISEGVCPGVEKAIQKMKKGETAQLAIEGIKYLPNEAFLKEHGIGNDATLTYEVQLRNFEKLKESWELDTPEKINQSELMKSHGTNFFKAGKYYMASVYYKKCVSYVEYHSDFTDDESKQKGQQLLQAGRLNLSLCYLKLNDYSQCIEECNKVIESDSKSDKAFFRRGQARLAMNDYEAALSDFKNVKALDPANKAANNQIVICQQKIKEQRMKEKKTFYGMFDKFAKIDAKKESTTTTSSEGDDQPAQDASSNGDDVDQKNEPEGNVPEKVEMDAEES